MRGEEEPVALQLAGEPRLAQQIREAAARGSLSHAVILSGRGDLAAAARFAAAAMECEGAGERPCGVCGPCRKVLKGTHPDVIAVEDTEHKNIAVEILRQKVADAYILPNEGRRKVYCFPDCSRLDPKAQNVLLKVWRRGRPTRRSCSARKTARCCCRPSVHGRRNGSWPPDRRTFTARTREGCAPCCAGERPRRSCISAWGLKTAK